MNVVLACPGLGRAFRGYERFAADLYRAANGSVHLTLVSGEGSGIPGEIPIGGLSRDGQAARILSAFSRDVFYWEAVSFAMLAWNRVARANVLHYSEPPLNLAFTRLERFSKFAPRRLFSHALGMDPEHTVRCHHIHETSPEAVDAARNIGVPDDRITLLPYGIWADDFRVERNMNARVKTRRAYGIPDTVPVLLCVAAVNRMHKRLDHLIAEVANLQKSVHLLICGAPEDATLLDDAKRILGESNVTHAYVPNTDMSAIYKASDLFVLPSLVEGFGLSLVEAQLSGLPVIAHDSRHFRWLLGSGSSFVVDMQCKGALTAMIERLLEDGGTIADEVHTVARAQTERYDWRHLTPAYVDMYNAVAAHPSQLIESLIGR